MWTSHPACPDLKWFPLQPGWIKINFDVAIIPHATILAAVGRRELGDILFAHSNLFLPSNLTFGETQAAFKALKLAVFCKYSYVLFEGDCKGVIDALQNIHMSPPWFLAFYFPDVKATISSLFCWKFSFISRDVNFLCHKTHNLAWRIAFCNCDGSISISSFLP